MRKHALTALAVALGATVGAVSITLATGRNSARDNAVSVGSEGRTSLPPEASAPNGDGRPTPGQDVAGEKDGLITEIIGDWHDTISSPEELFDKTDAVAIVRPTGPEVPIQPVDTTIVGRKAATPVEVVEVLQGDLRTGSPVRIVRTIHEADRVVNGQPPLERPAYLIGLVSTENSYGPGTWASYAGPHAMIAFDGTRDDSVVVPMAGSVSNGWERYLMGVEVGVVRQALYEARDGVALDAPPER